MDGTNATFLFDVPLLSEHELRPAGGILYIEDFDAEPLAFNSEVPVESVAPSYTAEELASAYTAGRDAGLAAALCDAQLMQAQIQSAAMQTVADGLSAARDMLSSIAEAAAAELLQTVFSVLHAAVPAAMRRHAADDLNLVIAALVPGLRCEPELRVRVHADMADSIRETLIDLLPADTCVLSVSVDAALAEGDIHLSWHDGHAQRDCSVIWGEIAAALGPLRLLTLKEICHGRGC